MAAEQPLNHAEKSQKSGWGDSNARPLRPERSALPTALHPDFPSADFEKSAAKLRQKNEIRAEKGIFFSKTTELGGLGLPFLHVFLSEGDYLFRR